MPPSEIMLTGEALARSAKTTAAVGDEWAHLSFCTPLPAGKMQWPRRGRSVALAPSPMERVCPAPRRECPSLSAAEALRHTGGGPPEHPLHRRGRQCHATWRHLLKK